MCQNTLFTHFYLTVFYSFSAQLKWLLKTSKAVTNNIFNISYIVKVHVTIDFRIQFCSECNCAVQIYYDK